MTLRWYYNPNLRTHLLIGRRSDGTKITLGSVIGHSMTSYEWHAAGKTGETASEYAAMRAVRAALREKSE